MAENRQTDTIARTAVALESRHKRYAGSKDRFGSRLCGNAKRRVAGA